MDAFLILRAGHMELGGGEIVMKRIVCLCACLGGLWFWSAGSTNAVAQQDLIGLYASHGCAGGITLDTTTSFEQVEIYLLIKNPSLGGAAGWECRVDIDNTTTFLPVNWTLEGASTINIHDPITEDGLFMVGIGPGPNALRPDSCDQMLLATLTGFVFEPDVEVTFRVEPYPDSVTFPSGCPGYVHPDDVSLLQCLTVEHDPAFFINQEIFIDPEFYYTELTALSTRPDGYDATDAGNIAGFSTHASDGPDVYDVEGTETGLYFETLRGPLDVDYRALFDPTAEMKQWTFVNRVLPDDSDGQTTLAEIFFDHYFGPYTGLDLQLYDQQAMVWTDLAATPYYSYTVPPGYDPDLRRFDLYMGTDPTPPAFSVMVDGQTETADDLDNVAGTADTATDGFDAGIDMPNPPLSPDDYLRVAFYHTDWATPFGAFWDRDIRAPYNPLNTSRSWLLRVDCDSPRPVNLYFSPSFTNPGIGLYLRNHESGEYVDLTTSGFSYDFMASYSGVNYFDLIVGTVETPPLTPASRTVAAGWSMLGVPIVPPSADLQSLILDDAGPAYLFSHDQGSGYTPLDGSDTHVQGAGYWLATMTGFVWDPAGDLDLDGVTLQLHLGWNLVGYPLWSPTTTNGIRVQSAIGVHPWGEAASMGLIEEQVLDYVEVAPGLWDYVDAGGMETWHGYWVKCLQPDVSLIFDIADVTTSAIHRYDPFVDSADESWRVDVKLLGSSSIVAFGETPVSGDGFDGRLDRTVRPPKPTGDAGATMYFDRPDLGLPGESRLIHDFRDINAKSALGWTATIVAPEPGPVTLSWRASGLDAAGRDLQVYLPQQNRVVVMSMASERSVTLDVGEAPLLVEFRTPALSGIEETPAVMDRLTVTPNPFNPKTTLRFTSSRGGAAQVKIFNLQGQLVRTLDVGDVRPGESYAAEWLGRDDRGRDASSGTYFATLSIDGARTGATRKMSLVR